LKTFKKGPHRVGWKSAYNQTIRFEKLIAIDNLNHCNILDLGCGLGGLYDFLIGQGWQGSYTGYDFLKMMVLEAKQLHPEAQHVFEYWNIFKKPLTGSWDYILMSGLFNIQLLNNWEFFKDVIYKIFPFFTHGIAFNVLAYDKLVNEPGLYYFNMDQLVVFLNSLPNTHFSIVSQYLDQDQTVYLYKKR
jgi:SAM-dependent methyltransferase